MNSGLYAACTALIARTQSLDVVANNLANVNTPGYKGQQATFRSYFADSGGFAASVLNRAVNDFAVLSGTRLDASAGNLERTGNNFDLALEGQGFFTLQTSAGIRYTRNGRFQVSANGELTTGDGDRVLGSNGPIRVPRGALTVSDDGTLSVNGALAGKLKLTVFDPGTELVSEGAGIYRAASAGKLATNAVVRQGMLEASNVNAVSSAVGLITLQRHAEMLQRALNLFHSEFNRIAAEDLPRL